MVVYFTTWSAEGSRDRRNCSTRWNSGTTNCGVAPGRCSTGSNSSDSGPETAFSREAMAGKRSDDATSSRCKAPKLDLDHGSTVCCNGPAGAWQANRATHASTKHLNRDHHITDSAVHTPAHTPAPGDRPCGSRNTLPWYRSSPGPCEHTPARSFGKWYRESSSSVPPAPS